MLVYIPNCPCQKMKKVLKGPGADPGFFLGGGALVSCSTSTPINHIVFVFCRIPFVLENRRSSEGGGGAHPLYPPPRSAPAHNLHQINFLQESFELRWKSAQHSISTSFAAKQVVRLCCPFYPSLKYQSNFKQDKKKTCFYSPILLISKNNVKLFPIFLKS